MRALIHCREVGWTRRLDLEASKPGVGEIWEAPQKEGQAKRIKAFGPGVTPIILATLSAADDLKIPNYTGW